MYELKVDLQREKMKQKELTHPNWMIDSTEEIKSPKSWFPKYKH